MKLFRGEASGVIKVIKRTFWELQGQNEIGKRMDNGAEKRGGRVYLIAIFALSSGAFSLPLIVFSCNVDVV